MEEKSQVQEIIATIKEKKHYLIGVCGIPGAGKSTVSDQLQKGLGKSVIVPMDGYHLYRKDLNQEGMKFRGAPHTFDLKKFEKKIKQVKSCQSFPLLLPSFDHAAKDPVQDSIQLTQDIQHVIVEGIYIFDKSMDLEQCWDYKIWLQADIETAMGRVAKRNFEAGISPSLEQSKERADFSDKKNALYVLQNSLKQNCTMIRT